jgi:hypothetical protein
MKHYWVGTFTLPRIGSPKSLTLANEINATSCKHAFTTSIVNKTKVCYATICNSILTNIY